MILARATVYNRSGQSIHSTGHIFDWQSYTFGNNLKEIGQCLVG